MAPGSAVNSAGRARRALRVWLPIALAMAASAVAAAQGRLKPYSLAYTTSGDLRAETRQIKRRLTDAGFEIAGEYAPFHGAVVIAITNDALRRAAARSRFGGYGAAQRVTLTRVGETVQVAYTNPVYWAHAFRMTGDLRAVAASLERSLGHMEQFGAFHQYSLGISAGKLREYHYTVAMEYFDDPLELAEHASHRAAVDAVEAGLAAGQGGVHKVYRIDIPGKAETVFGVRMTKGCSADAYIIKRVDRGGLRCTAYLPYEMLVSGNRVYALHARFRIAISFLGLPMLTRPGGGTFVDILCAPGAIEEALRAAAGPKADREPLE